MSKSLIRLIDEAILPAFLIVGLKVVSIAIVNDLLSLNYLYENFGKLYYSIPNDAVLVNTYSDFIVFLGIGLCVIFILVQSIFAPSEESNESALRKLIQSTRTIWIRTTFKLYQMLFVWMLFLTGVVLYILTRALYGIDNFLVMLPTTILYLVLMWVVLKEIERNMTKRIDVVKDIV